MAISLHEQEAPAMSATADDSKPYPNGSKTHYVPWESAVPEEDFEISFDGNKERHRNDPNMVVAYANLHVGPMGQRGIRPTELIRGLYDFWLLVPQGKHPTTEKPIKDISECAVTPRPENFPWSEIKQMHVLRHPSTEFTIHRVEAVFSAAQDDWERAWADERNQEMNDFKALIDGLPKKHQITKLVCFGLGSFGAAPRPGQDLAFESAWGRNGAYQHAMVLSIQQRLQKTSKDKIKLLVQDPDYDDAHAQVLGQRGFTLLDWRKHQAFVEVDDSTFVVSIGCGVPVEKIICDTRTPAAMLWKTIPRVVSLEDFSTDRDIWSYEMDVWLNNFDENKALPENDRDRPRLKVMKLPGPPCLDKNVYTPSVRGMMSNDYIEHEMPEIHKLPKIPLFMPGQLASHRLYVRK